MPGKEINTTNLLFTQTSSVDYEELFELDVLRLADPPTIDQAVVYGEFKEQLQRSDELYKWHSDLPELESEVTEHNTEDQTFAKQQMVEVEQ